MIRPVGTSPLLLATVLAVLVGCRPAPAPIAVRPTRTAASKPKGFVIYTYDGRIPIVLQDDYGVMLINDGDARKPRARYILAIRKGRKLLDTHRFAVFQKALRRIPTGTAVYRYDTCTVLRSYGLPPSEFERFDRAMRGFRRMTEADFRGVCTCEALG